MYRKTPYMSASAVPFHAEHNQICDLQQTQAAGLERRDVITPSDSPETSRKQGDKC